MDSMGLYKLAAASVFSACVVVVLMGCVSNETLQAVLESDGRSFCQGVCVNDTRAEQPQPEQEPVEVKLTIEIDQGQVVDANVEPMGSTVEDCYKENQDGCTE